MQGLLDLLDLGRDAGTDYQPGLADAPSGDWKLLPFYPVRAPLLGSPYTSHNA